MPCFPNLLERYCSGIEEFAHDPLSGVAPPLPAEEGRPIIHLLLALREKKYPAIYARLRKLKFPLFFSDSWALALCQQAIHCTPRCFREVLDCCRRQVDMPLSPLVLHAAYYDRNEHLQILLDAGASPNSSSAPSPLGMAVWQRSFRCLDLLLARPDLDRELPEDVLISWGAEGLDPFGDFCLSAVADRLLAPRDSPFDPIPLPPRLTLPMAAQMNNAALLERLVRTCRSVPVDEARDALERLELDHPDAGRMVGDIFTACPAALEDPLSQWLLVAAALQIGKVPPELAPWIARLEGADIPLYIDLPLCKYFPEVVYPSAPGLPDTWRALLERWRQVLGEGLTPILRREDSLPGPLSGIVYLSPACLAAEDLEALLRCPVRGRPDPGRASPFAQSLVAAASPGALARALGPGGPLAGENLRELAQAPLLLGDHSPRGLAKRAVLLSHIA